MRSYRVQDSLIAVSANTAEVSINAGAVLDTSLQLASGDMLAIEPRRETNESEMTGLEEKSVIYALGQTASGTFTFEKAKPSDVAFLYAFCLGNIATGAAGTGYQHVITPIAADYDPKRSNPSFCAAMRLGGILKRKFSGCFVDSVTVTYAKDAFVKATGSIKATGKIADNIVSETVSALDNVTSLTLAANGVYGATADERVDSIHEVRVELTSGVWTQVTVTAVSAAEPAELTIESAGGAGTETVSYKILYRVLADAGMETFPDKVVEPPLRTSEVMVNFGGTWNGTTFTGGRTMTCELKSVECTTNNNGQIEYCFGEAGDYAGRMFRDGRDQTLKVDRDFRDMIIQQMQTDNEYFGMHIKAESRTEFDTGHKYTIEHIYPRLGITAATPGTDGKRLSESVSLQVLHDAIYGSCIVRVKNLVSVYAA